MGESIMCKYDRACLRLVFLSVFLIVWLIASFVMVSTVLAQSDMFIYPKQGQSDAQLEKDKYECYSWAKKQSNFDPMEIPKATAPPPKQEAKKGGAGRGALRGALLGAAIGEIANDDAGKGAAIGAGTGALFGGVRRQRQVQQQDQAEQQWAQEQTAQYAQKRNSYNRAYAACLEARGYTVR
jgi:hypothetical protein